MIIGISELSQHSYGECQAIKSFVSRLPRPFSANETFDDWWPLSRQPQYRYKITNAIYETGQRWIDTEFLLQIRKSAHSDTQYIFDIQGFDDFPYTGLRIETNRVFLFFHTPEVEEFIILTFPLFADMVYADESYEYEFLKTMVRETSNELTYAPVRNDFYCVESVNGNLFEILRCEGGRRFIFHKGIGIETWTIRGGYELQLMETTFTTSR